MPYDYLQNRVLAVEYLQKELEGVCIWNVQNVNSSGAGCAKRNGIGIAWETIGLAKVIYPQAIVYSSFLDSHE